MKTETVIESTPANVRLAPAQAAALNHLGRRLAGARQWWGQGDETDDEHSVITCQPRGRTLYTLRVADAVGVVSVPGLQLVVRPKIPIRHLLYLLQAGDALPRTLDSGAEVLPDVTLWDLAARWFVTALETLLRHDLISDYREAIDELTLVRGRILVTPTVRDFYAGTLRAICQFDEYDTDNALNRVLKAAAQVVAASALLTEELRRRAARALAVLESVGALRPDDCDVETDRRTRGYTQALTLAKVVLGRQGYTIATGPASAWTFLFRTPEVVEAGVRAILKEGLSTSCPVVKRGVTLKPSRMTLNPDLVFGEAVAVGDVKYRLAERVWKRDQLYQATTFAAGFRTRSAAVIAFGRPPLELPPIVRVGDISVRAFAWRADEGLMPEAAASELTDGVRDWIVPLLADAQAVGRRAETVLAT